VCISRRSGFEGFWVVGVFRTGSMVVVSVVVWELGDDSVCKNDR
jgi:hypothetical protein